MKVDITPGRKKFDSDDEGEETEEEGGPRLIRPQTFPSTPVPQSYGPKILEIINDSPLEVNWSIRRKVDDEGGEIFSFVIRRKK